MPIHLSRTTRLLFGFFVALLSAVPVFGIAAGVTSSHAHPSGPIIAWTITGASFAYACVAIRRLLGRPCLLISAGALLVRHPALMAHPLRLAPEDVSAVFLTPRSGKGRHVRGWDPDPFVDVAARTYQQLTPPVVRLGVTTEECTLAIVLSCPVTVTRPTSVVTHLIEKTTMELPPKLVRSLLLPVKSPAEVMALLNAWRDSSPASASASGKVSGSP